MGGVSMSPSKVSTPTPLPTPPPTPTPSISLWPTGPQAGTRRELKSGRCSRLLTRGRLCAPPLEREQYLSKLDVKQKEIDVLPRVGELNKSPNLHMHLHFCVSRC